MKIVYRRRALADLDAIYSYIAQHDLRAARRVIARISEAVRRLERFPYSARPGQKPGTRELSVPGLPYLVIYKVSENQGGSVEIVAIYHTAVSRKTSDY